MKDDAAKRGRKTRHNWLLIKEKDDAAKPGKPDTLLKADTSVKSGRTLDEIAKGSKKVWHSDASKKKAASPATGSKKKAKRKAKRPVVKRRS
jgi:bifunctional non-homologous end joining protein LigD